MPNNLNASSDGYRVTAAQFAVKAIANTPRSPRFLLVSDPEAPIAGGRDQQKHPNQWRRRSNREAVWRDPSTRSDLSRARFSQMIDEKPWKIRLQIRLSPTEHDSKWQLLPSRLPKEMLRTILLYHKISKMSTKKAKSWFQFLNKRNAIFGRNLVWLEGEG